VAIEPVWH